MDEQEWLRRIDQHLETSNDYMRDGNELMARIGDTLERNSTAFVDLRGFLQQVTTVLGALTAEILEGRREFVEENRAQRRALFTILDRLEGGPPPCAT